MPDGWLLQPELLTILEFPERLSDQTFLCLLTLQELKFILNSPHIAEPPMELRAIMPVIPHLFIKACKVPLS